MSFKLLKSLSKLPDSNILIFSLLALSLTSCANIGQFDGASGDERVKQSATVFSFQDELKSGYTDPEMLGGCPRIGAEASSVARRRDRLKRKQIQRKYKKLCRASC